MEKGRPHTAWENAPPYMDESASLPGRWVVFCFISSPVGGAKTRKPTTGIRNDTERGMERIGGSE